MITFVAMYEIMSPNVRYRDAIVALYGIMSQCAVSVITIVVMYALNLATIDDIWHDITKILNYGINLDMYVIMTSLYLYLQPLTFMP